MHSVIAIETSLQRRFAGLPPARQARAGRRFVAQIPVSQPTVAFVRSFEVDTLTKEAVILIDDEWQAVSIPIARFRCRLAKGATITVPFDERNTPNWEGAVVEEISVQWIPVLETSTFEANHSFA
jgi:hypothetical protein